MNSFFSNSMNNADNDWENPMNHHVPSSYGNHNYDLPQGRMNQIKVLGVPVDFPYQNIYPSQRALIANSIKAFQNQENALLQAPTGTGKALALLAASLAYQQHVIDQKIIINHPRNNSLSQVRANDTFAIFSGSGSFQDPASEPSHFNIQPPRIWFTSRTHTQLKQLISEYKRLPYNPTMVVLGGRKQLCLNKKVLKSNDRDGECRKLLEENKCPFRMKAGIPPEFRRGGKYEKFEIEDMLEYGKKNMRCAYHMSLVILSKADLVFCPYNYVLDPKIKGQLELSLVGSFLIIDEAHNVENICREAGTFKITSDDLNFTLMIFRKLKENFIKEDPDFVSLILLLDFVQTISKWFTSQINGMKFLKQKERIENPITVINEWGLNQETWPQYEFVMTTIIKRKVVVVEEVNQKPHFEIPLRSLSLLENLFIFFVFIFQNNMENANNFQIPIVVGNKDDGSEDFMQIVCLTPSVVFKCISRETHSLILASGTLSPLSTFASELGTKFPIQISANHIIGPDQLQSYIVTHALDGTPFNSSYQTMSANKDNILMGLAKMFETLLPEIPGGVLFFLPSYSVMAELTSFWKRNGFWKTINKIKHIFVEDRNNAELIYSKYIDFVERGDGGLLIGVCRGSMSEGMDFSDTQARAVFLFGIPYPSYMDLEVRMKRTYNDKMCVTANSTNSNTTNINNNNTRNDVNNAISGSEWYETQAFRGVFQAIGRCIRHQNDYGSIVIVDQRFPNFVSKFPRWVSQSFVNHIGISDIKARMHDFYKDMEIKFPKKVLFTRGQRVIFVCDNCGELVVDIPKIDVDEAEQTRKAGFLKFVEAGNSINCLFLSRNTKKKLYVQESVDYLWSEEDLIAYNMVKCKCGSKLGMFIAATTREDSNYINGYMFLLNRLKIANNADSSQQKNSSQKSPSRSRSQRKKDSQNDSGQMKLSFL